MRNRHTEVFDGKTGKSWFEIKNWTLEEHIEDKLRHVGTFITGSEKDKGLNQHDFRKYTTNKAVLTKEKIAAIEAHKSIELKHADIKKLIKSAKQYIGEDLEIENIGHELLDTIAWSDFKKKFLWFFSVEY